MLAKHQNCPTDKHIASAKYAIKYLKGTKARGITFDSRTEDKLKSYIHFPISSSKLTGISDANWGPQDQSKPKENMKQPELELFKTRSISGHVITLHCEDSRMIRNTPNTMSMVSEESIRWRMDSKSKGKTTTTL